jgi:hypothetical protein
MRTFPLLVMILGSPFFFKNFMFSIGYLDILGCLAALIAILLPVNLALPIVMGAIACVLLLVHHIHFLLYLPTIAFIVIARALAAGRLTRRFSRVSSAAAIAAASLFVYLVLYGSVTTPMDAFIDAPEYIVPAVARVWFTDIRYEIAQTMAMLPSNALRFPVYVAVVLIHLPLISYFRELIRSLKIRRDRIMVRAGLIAISMSYVPVFVVVFDYSRWVSNWATCMILVMHTTRLLPSFGLAPTPVDARSPRNRLFGWIIALVPRVGIIKPF